MKGETMKRTSPILMKSETYNVNVGRQWFQIIESFSSAKIAGAKNMLHFIWNQQLAKFRRDIMASVWYVKITDDKNQLKNL